MFPLKDNAPTRSFPVVTAALIAINAAVWIFYQLPDLNGSVTELAYQPCAVTSSADRTRYLPAFLSVFICGGL